MHATPAVHLDIFDLNILTILGTVVSQDTEFYGVRTMEQTPTGI
jgi:hypothetical protein